MLRYERWDGPYGPIVDDPDALTDEYLQQQDFVDNTVYRFLCDLTGQQLPWDIAIIHEVFDFTRVLLYERYGIRIPYAEFDV